MTTSWALSAILAHNSANRVKVWPFRETSRHSSRSTNASARNPSCFSSKIQSSLSKGFERRESRTGRISDMDEVYQDHSANVIQRACGRKSWEGAETNLPSFQLLTAYTSLGT